MKKYILSAIIGALCMLLVLYCIAAVDLAKATEDYEHIDFLSNLSREACFLCGSSNAHWGEDNVGILNLNTFELLYIEINRYDGHGQRVEKPAGYMQSDGISKMNAYTYPDRGYSQVWITDVQYAVDREIIQTRLCQTCLDTVNNMHSYGNAPAEYAVVNFADRTFRPLIKSYPWFLTGDFGIDCEFGDNGTINLLIHYSPNRYTDF